MSLRVAIAGASGYAGGEMARLVGAHPELELGVLSAHRNEGREVRSIHPHLRSVGDTVFHPTDLSVLADHDAVVLALPHGQSGELGEGLLATNPALTVVDLGADRRLVNSSDWERFYGGNHYEPWAYGMPELVLANGSQQRSSLVGATRIAAPGCNASAITFAFAPLVYAGIIDSSQLVSTLAVGPSGAGRTLREDLLASERLSSAMAYAVGGTHRHIPEIVQSLGLSRAAQGEGHRISMTPVLVPMARGILAVNTAPLLPGATEAQVMEAFHAAYGGELFVELSPTGVMPSSGSMLGSNTVGIGWSVDQASGRVTVVSAIDNLVKGTAGAALQSLNVAKGFPEHLGLTTDGIAP